MSLLNFDATSVDSAAPYDVIPAGEYLSCVVDSQVKTTKAGNGEYLELVFEVMEGQYKGRKVWQRVNIKNPNPKAEAAAKRELSSLCKAVGVLNVQYSEVLHNIPLMVQLQVEEGSNGYGPQNRVKSYGSAGSTAPAQTPAPAAISAAAASSSVPVWKRPSA
jgi:hypothetical protein